MYFTQQEKSVLLELVNRTQVSPGQANASEVLSLLQSIIKKLTAVDEIAK